MKNSEVLALKYRPKSLKDLIGQDIVAKTIFNSIKNNKIPNAYLFHGIRGTGKTSIARIIAKSLNCEKGIENLCEKNFCSNCEAISNSNHLDVIEQDCATATGIDSVRDLIEFCRYPPSQGKFKVLILDEIQAMSKAGAQSLLKILEEPPPYVKFIFCTTEIKKILITLLSRCSRFDLQRVNFEMLFQHLKKISILEKGKITDEAIRLICKCSEGSVRDALSLLDRALLSTNDSVMDLNLAQKIFGHFDKTLIIDLLKYVLEGNEEKAIEKYKTIFDFGIEPNIFLNDFLEILYYLKNINLINLSGNSFDMTENNYKELKNLSKQIETKTLILFWQFTIKTLDEISIVSNQDIAIEMFIIRLLHLKERKKIEASDNIEDKNFEKNKNLEFASSLKNKDKNDLINQIKNIAQKEEPQTNIENVNIKDINSFKNLIEVCTEKKEMNLKYDLETNVNLVSFEKNRIEISFNENLKKDFIKTLSSKLYEWTNNRWIISLSKNQGSKSVKEKQLIVDSNEMDEFKKTKAYKKIKDIFEDSKLSKIENIKL